MGVLAAVRAFAAVEGTAAFDSQRYGLTDVPTLTVTDADLNISSSSKQTVGVSLRSTTDANGITVTLRESGNDTGIFNEASESIEFSTIASNDLLNTLHVSAGDTLTLTYADAAPSGSRTATATMFANTGTVTLDDTRYGTGDTVTVTVSDVDRNDTASVAETVTATLTSPEDATGVVLTLIETSANAGTFSGTASFEDNGGSSTGSALEVDPSDTITVTYVEPQFDGTTTANRTDTALMQVSGSASLNAGRYDFNDTVTLSVDDDDLNSDAGSAQSVNVNLASGYDATGITVSLTETGADTGTFSGTATFVQGGSSSGTTLAADPGDVVTMTYVETTTETGTPANRTDTAIMFENGASASLDKARYDTAETVTLTATDADRNQNGGSPETLSVTLHSTSDATLGINVTLNETGADTGSFSGTASFSTVASNDLMDRLLVAQGDTVTLTYAEPNASGTGTTARTATATILEDGNAVPEMDARRYTTNATPEVTVAEPDANAQAGVIESIQATLSSTTDATGITVDLTESGTDTGTFDIVDSGIGFSTGGSSNDATNTLRVTAGDTITLTYLEPQADGSGTDARTATATIFVDSAAATLDAVRYAVDDTAALSVTDVDANGSASSADTLQVSLSSTTDATGVTVTLTESGTDTSIFDGSATFTGSGSSSGSMLRVATGDVISLTYAEPEADGVGMTARTDDATMHIDGAAALDALRYQNGATATLTVTDADLNTNSGSTQTVDVALDDVDDVLGSISVQLTETGANTGVFTGAAVFTTGLSNDVGDALHIGAGDTVRMTYAETTAFSGSNADRTDDATMFADTAIVAFGAGGYGAADTASVAVTDADRNADIGVIETVQAAITSPEDGSGVTITLTEASANSSTFNGSVTFENDGGGSTGSNLEINAGATITATYVEPQFDGVGTANRTDTALMHGNGAAALDAERYAFAATATLSVTDDDLNTSSGSAQSVDVTFSSEADPTGVTVTLNETGMNTGDFVGLATFSSTASSDPLDRLLAAQGDTITLTYEETTTESGTAADRTATAVMFIDDAVARFTANAYALAGTATVRVTDADADLDPDAIETVTAKVGSDSDGTGFSITLTETGETTGIFHQTITFSTDPSDAGTRALEVAEGDTVTVEYEEPNASGLATTARTGTAQMFDATATLVLDADKYSVDESPSITVTDLDRNLDGGVAEQVVAAVTSSSDPTGVDVTLTETGANSGTFTGTADLTTGASTATALSVDESDILNAAYTEPLFAGGTASRTDAAEMRVNGSAGLDGDAYALADTASMTVSDPDVNTNAGATDTVEVALASTSDATGIVVTLTETGVNTGAFTGTATFTTGSSSGTVLHVASGDSVTLTYDETSTFDGPDTDRTDTASFPTDGAIALDASSYALDDTVTIAVEDADLNTAAGSQQSVDVTLVSTTDASGVLVELTETAVDSGVFSGTATFTAGTSSGSALQVAQGDVVTATYAETTTFNGTPANRTDSAGIWLNGTVALDVSVYSLDDTATITVTDDDLDTSSGSAQSVNVTLASTTDATGVSVGLTETGANTGIFSGTASFATASSSGSALLVAQGDLVTTTYAETTTFDGTPADRTDTAGLRVNGTIALDASTYALEDAATITVGDADLNTTAGSAQSVNVTLASTTDATGVTVGLTETGADTGIFTGTATFTTGSSSGTALQIAQGDALTATYAEITTFQGPDAVRTDTANVPVNGTIALDGVVYALDDTATITVSDADLNTAAGSAQSVNVTLASTTDATGVTVGLTETGADTGIFAGTATFTAASSSGTTLQVAQADTVTTTYEEVSTFQGPDAVRADTAGTPVNGTIALDASAYALEDAATITVSDADLNTAAGSAQSVNVTLASTTDATGVTVDLTETGANTGVFRGTATFSTAASSGTVLQITAGDTVTATYGETTTFQGPNTDRTDVASVPGNGIIALDASAYSLDDTATITVTDAELNTAAGSAQSVEVTLDSSADAVGVTVNLTETAADSGIFTGTASFSTGSSNGTVLQIAAGDTVTATYGETTTFEGPSADRTDTARMHVNGTLGLDDDAYTLDDTATITVTDDDLDTSSGSAQSVNVTLASTTDATGVTVGLTETGANSGIFSGTATFATAPSSGSTLQVAQGDTLTATYAEATTLEGPNADRTDVAGMPVNGTIALDDALYALSETATMTLTDADLNTAAGSAQSVDVALTSETDGDGVKITLDETGADTGIFTGTATFSASSSSGTILQVSEGDDLTTTYEETTTFQGPDASRTATARLLADATMALDATGYALDDTATIMVTDAEVNVDDEGVELLDATFSSVTDTTGVTVELTETGADTGIFTGMATFTSGASSGTSLQIAEGELVTATYQETSTFAGAPADRTATAAMHADGAITLDAELYSVDDSTTVSITDPDGNTDPAAPDEVDASLTSSADGTGITISLTETGADTGIFTSTATFTTGSSFGDELKVAYDGSVTATYQETTTFEGPDAARTDAAAIAGLVGPTFADVATTFWAYESIEAFYGAEITSGCATDPLRYCPNNSVTRSQMAVFLIRAMEEEGNLEPYRGLFSDVPATAGYARYVERLADLGVTGGCAPGRFCPGDTVTRAQMAVFLIRAMGEQDNLEPALGLFTDVPASAWYARYVERLADLGVTGGCSATKFCPSMNVNRAQMAVFMVKAFDL